MSESIQVSGYCSSPTIGKLVVRRCHAFSPRSDLLFRRFRAYQHLPTSVRRKSFLQKCGKKQTDLSPHEQLSKIMRRKGKRKRACCAEPFGADHKEILNLRIAGICIYPCVFVKPFVLVKFSLRGLRGICLTESQRTKNLPPPGQHRDPWPGDRALISLEQHFPLESRMPVSPALSTPGDASISRAAPIDLVRSGRIGPDQKRGVQPPTIH